MATLNTITKGSMKTTNISGHAAYRLDDKTRLVTMALTTMLGEPKYYGDNTSDLIQLAESMCKAGEGEFVAKLAVWARTKGKLRSVSHALIAVVAHECGGEVDAMGESFIRKAACDVASMRADDGTEILATGISLYGAGFKKQNALRRGIRDALETTKPYAIAKYQSGNRMVKMRDTLRITHPNAVTDGTKDAMGKCIEGTLSVPKSWETEISARGNTKEVWNELIREDRIPIFACVRNLRNMIKAGADLDLVLDKITNRDAILKSRLLPFRFYSAYRELVRAGVAQSKVSRALDMALTISCNNIEPLPGSTAVLVDTSGSMGSSVSARGTVTCRDIAATLAAIVTHISGNALVIGFDGDARIIPMSGLSVLSDIERVPDDGGWTNMKSAFMALMQSGFVADRVVVLSDYEVNGRWSGGNKDTIQRSMDAYRRMVGRPVWCHAIDLQGYGTQQFIGPQTNVLAGWSENMLKFISIVENGFGGLVDEIESTEL